MFADDTKLYRDIANQSDIEIIQNDINNLFKWSEKWLLRFHPDKCKVLSIIGKRHQQRTTKYTMPTYSGSYVTLESVESEKDIGVTIDSKPIMCIHMYNVQKIDQFIYLASYAGADPGGGGVHPARPPPLKLEKI